MKKFLALLALLLLPLAALLMALTIGRKKRLS